MQTINLDISVKSIIPLLHAKQADVGRKFKVVLSDGGKAYPLPGGERDRCGDDRADACKLWRGYDVHRDPYR